MRGAGGGEGGEDMGEEEVEFGRVRGRSEGSELFAVISSAAGDLVVFGVVASEAAEWAESGGESGRR